MQFKDRIFLELFLRNENFNHVYSREYYDLVQYLGDLGGLLDVVLVFGWILTSFFSFRLFQSALVSSTYKLQKYN